VQLLSQLGEAVGVADGEPYTECISGQVAKLLVNFQYGCKSVVCDWLVAAS